MYTKLKSAMAYTMFSHSPALISGQGLSCPVDSPARIVLSGVFSLSCMPPVRFRWLCTFPKAVDLLGYLLSLFNFTFTF